MYKVVIADVENGDWIEALVTGKIKAVAEFATRKEANDYGLATYGDPLAEGGIMWAIDDGR